MKRRKYKRPLRPLDRVCTRMRAPHLWRLTNACVRAHPWYDDFDWENF